MIVEHLNIGCLTGFVLYVSLRDDLFSLPDFVRDCIIDCPLLAMMLRLSLLLVFFVTSVARVKPGLIRVIRPLGFSAKLGCWHV